jgi:Zn-dependent protease/predicted transcriptional regulator
MAISSQASRGLRFARVHGIELRLDVSVVLIFALIVASLGASLVPSWHPQWSGALVWSVALATGIAFFVSLLAHELAHSIVAQRYGIAVPRITLFLFGGVSEMSEEPRSPAAEFTIAIVGPLMSLAIGVLCVALGNWWAPHVFADALVRQLPEALAALDPLGTVLVWLGPVNIVLAIFNLVPGFPLDGGRVLRALLWWIGGDQVRATRWAANGGRFFAWLLMAFGVVNLLWGHALNGIWFIFIGWFLANAARASYSQLLLQQTLGGLRVRDLMRTQLDSVAADLPLDAFVEQKLVHSGQVLWPVVAGERLAGWVAVADVVRVAERDRAGLSVRDVMRPRDAVATLAPGLSGRVALERLSNLSDEPTPVLDDGRVVGMLHGADVLRWVALHRFHEQV